MKRSSARRPVAVVLAVLLCGALAPAGSVSAADRFITVASTTSTENSGLFGHILPLFRDRTGIEVRVVAQGTGQALQTGVRGDADVVFVHARVAEEKFVADGHGEERRPVMFNDFVIVGPDADPAGISGSGDAAAAFGKIAASQSPFASRGDDSGTHKAELALWKAADLDPRKAGGGWYRETGSGMGATLNIASQMGAYALADRATWISFRNREGLGIAVEGDARLINHYRVILVSPARHPHVKKADGQAFIDWLAGPDGQAAIASFALNGEQLFFPNAGRKGM
ncbi:MAG: substrate-binding domain-containing protein [Rhodospirillaceae bacterium]